MGTLNWTRLLDSGHNFTDYYTSNNGYFITVGLLDSWLLIACNNNGVYHSEEYETLQDAKNTAEELFT